MLNKLQWLQYNPEWKSQFGGMANRAGINWDTELMEGYVYFYDFDAIKDGYLADMSLEF